MKYLSALAILVCVCAASPAHAKTWTVDTLNSHIGFTGTQGSAPFQGGFRKLQVTIDFDPANPETGKITATIDMASAYAGSEERDSALPQADWFNVAQFPQAKFSSTAIRKTGDNAYEASGLLTIKTVTLPVTLPFTLTTQPNGTMRAQGKLTLMRNDFGVGQGQWSAESYVKHAVDVTIDIVAR